MDIKNRLLASIEIHGKCDISGILNLYPTFSKFTVLRNLFTLKNEGWIYIRKTRIENEERIKVPNVRRTKKTMYSQIPLDLPA